MDRMRMIPTQVHGVIDYLGGIVLLLAPNLFNFEANDAATAVARIVGIAILGLAILTRYELGLIKVIPMEVHLLIDIVASIFLAASPFLFQFSDDPTNVWLPHVVVGIGYLIITLMTERTPRGDVVRTPDRSAMN